MENKEQPLVELKAMDKGPLLVKGPVKLITPDHGKNGDLPLRSFKEPTVLRRITYETVTR